VGKREEFFVRTATVSIHPLQQFGSRQQPGGFDHRSLPMDPLRLQRVEPGAVAGQGTSHTPDALALPFNLLIVLSEPVLSALTPVGDFHGEV
jgi:hypothetical protein